MRLPVLAFYLAAASAAVVPTPARADVSFEVSFGAPPGEAIASVDVFYDQLAPYGMWLEEPQFGTVFMPDDGGYVPYTNGHWEYTDVGMVWVSSEPFAWVTSHYGRWWFSDRYQRWAWVPDTAWGPSWVDWRESGGYLGWSPMPPQIVIDQGYSAPIAAWHFCPADRIVDVDVTRYYVPRERVVTYQRQARPIAATATIDHRSVVVGPSADMLRAHHVAVQPRRVEPRTLGRMNPTELRTIETRARERAPQVQQQNQQRVQQHPQLRQAQPAAPPAQRRVEPPRVQQPQTTPAPRAQPQQQPAPAPQPERRTVEPRTQPRQPTRQLEPRKQVQQPQPQPKARPEPPRAQPQVKAQPQQQPRKEAQPNDRGRRARDDNDKRER